MNEEASTEKEFNVDPKIYTRVDIIWNLIQMFLNFFVTLRYFLKK